MVQTEETDPWRCGGKRAQQILIFKLQVMNRYWTEKLVHCDLHFAKNEIEFSRKSEETLFYGSCPSHIYGHENISVLGCRGNSSLAVQSTLGQF